MVQVKIAYQGQLHCLATHGPSGASITTDAPVDNMGKGEFFSPTDLVGTALGTCIMTIMGIVAQRNNISLEGMTATVVKEMVSQPARRIGKLTLTIDVPTRVSQEDRQRLENAAHTCPVKRSLHPDVEVQISFNWA
jgi:putative redox protein